MAAAGRFAPTPSGPLHYGSLVATLASYCHARSQQAPWLLRIEDVDTPRIVDGASDQLQRDLEAFGFEWDGPVLWQSDRFERYRHHLENLIEAGDCFACECSRRILREQQVPSGPLGQIYPGSCRSKGLKTKGHSIRLNTANAGSIVFHDQVYGAFALDLPDQVGDFVLQRADGIYAYHLAVVVDDEEQGIEEVVRGADLLENTCLHIYLQQKLGFKTPRYLHVPLINNPDGSKLSKQTGAAAIEHEQAVSLLIAALEHLGQQPNPDLESATRDEVLKWAIDHWNPKAIRAVRAAIAETFGE